MLPRYIPVHNSQRLYGRTSLDPSPSLPVSRPLANAVHGLSTLWDRLPSPCPAFIVPPSTACRNIPVMLAVGSCAGATPTTATSLVATQPIHQQLLVIHGLVFQRDSSRPCLIRTPQAARRVSVSSCQTACMLPGKRHPSAGWCRVLHSTSTSTSTRRSGRIQAAVTHLITSIRRRAPLASRHLE